MLNLSTNLLKATSFKEPTYHSSYLETQSVVTGMFFRGLVTGKPEAWLPVCLFRGISAFIAFHLRSAVLMPLFTSSLLVSKASEWVSKSPLSLDVVRHLPVRHHELCQHLVCHIH